MFLLDNVVMDYSEKKLEKSFSGNYFDFEDEYEKLGKGLVSNLKHLENSFSLNNKQAINELSTRIYLALPFLTCCSLNYKISVEGGLEIHNTKYVSLKDRCCEYSVEEKVQAHDYFVNSVSVSKKILSSSFNALGDLERHLLNVPSKLKGFVYSSHVDIYTYLASHPSRLKTLSEKIKRGLKRPFVVGTAHGAILPGLVVSTLLGGDCYFLRFSQYKRFDEGVIISDADREVLLKNKRKQFVLLDEDLASGNTLFSFKKSIEEILGRRVMTSAVLSSSTSRFRPDFFADYLRV